jgi:hypothetical protein
VKFLNKCDRDRCKISFSNVLYFYSIKKKPHYSQSNFSSKIEWKNNNREAVKIMSVRQPRYNKEKFAQRGDYLYETQLHILNYVNL